MEKIYEATGEYKRNLIELENEIESFNKVRFYGDPIKVKDIMMVGRTNNVPIDYALDIHWSLNGTIRNKESRNDIIVLEPLEEQLHKQKIKNLSANDTYFDGKIKLSKKSIVLIPTDMYYELITDLYLKQYLDNMDVRLYSGEEDLAIRMIFYERNYTYIDIDENGYIIDKHKFPDIIEYTEKLIEFEKQLFENLKDINVIIENNEDDKTSNMVKDNEDIELDESYRKITGLTKKTEGDINLGEELYATTNIGKIRENQEDAVLLMKDKNNPNFKMMVVADGMGGWQNGEVASDVVVNRLKKWFMSLSKEEKNCYYTGLVGLEESLIQEIYVEMQEEVVNKTECLGGTTIVCAIVGKEDTLIVNIGDSRAYISKNGKLIQVSREDTVANENLKKGKTPSKEAARFDIESNQLVQCIGMRKRDLMKPHTEIIKNSDYDMILLFSDGVTDCLSDEDIAVVCKNTDKEELTNRIVEKAIRHDSIKPEEFEDYIDMHNYIPGGKDNTTAAVYIPKEENER